MNSRRITRFTYYLIIIAIAWASVTGCSTTKHLKEDEYLLRANVVNLKSNEVITRRGEIKENLAGLVVQKPNTWWSGFIPYKLWLYNTRYKKYSRDSLNFQIQSKTVEPPVVHDSSLQRKSIQNMKAYLFHQGYFYSQITDTVIYKKKKAYVNYNVRTGSNYLIKNVEWEVHDSLVGALVSEHSKNTLLKQGTEFSYPLLQEEQSRITAIMRNYGYYKFSNDMISFVLDTLNKQYLRDIENPFESAINFIALQKQQKKPTLNIKVNIKSDEDSTGFYRYGINRVRVFTDYEGPKDFRDSSMTQEKVSGLIFRFHKGYVNSKVVQKHIFLKPETYYAQKDYDQTISRLNELGVFQSVRITFREDTARGPGWLNSNIFLTPGKKMDFHSNVETSSGTTYTLGGGLTVGYRNRNFAKGANLLSITATGSLESQFDSSDKPFFKRFFLLTKSLGVNASLEFPKFLIPIAESKISPRNAPRTIVGTGWNLLDRVNYFTLINTSANFTYRWKETETKSWEVSPAFVNVISLPFISDEFRARLEGNEYLKNSYRNTLIEGENVTFTFTDRERKSWRNYNYLRLSVEEAGGIIGGISSLLGTENYSRYVKFDFDAQRFFNYVHSTVALRFTGGVGLPYGTSTTLPYVKQYFVGGSFSIRGWRIRSLGPGSYVAPRDTTGAVNVIDRTGDIKLEMNGEYRFDITQLFSGAIKMNGALFADAGNIWLTRPSSDFPGGEFHLNKFGSDIAVSTGVGLRFDAGGFFVLRTDVAMPVRKPDYIQGDGWVLDQVNFGDKAWRKENLVFMIAVGYPF